jgi:hypothetical protein
MAAQDRSLAEQRRGRIPRRCQRAGVAGIRPWLGCPQRIRAFNALVGGVGVASRTRGGPTLDLSEAESHTRVYVALERGGVPLQGASSPRARRGFARGGVQPSSEAEFCLRRAGASYLLGRWRYPVRGRVNVICRWWVHSCFCYFAKNWVPPRLLGELMAVPNSSPRASAAVSVRNP